MMLMLMSGNASRNIRCRLPVRRQQQHVVHTARRRSHLLLPSSKHTASASASAITTTTTSITRHFSLHCRHSPRKHITCPQGIRIRIRQHLIPSQPTPSRWQLCTRRSHNHNSNHNRNLAVARASARVLGSITSWLWRSGYVTWAWRNRHTPAGKLGLLLLALPCLLLGGLLGKHAEVIPYSHRLHLVFLSKQEEDLLGVEGEQAILRQEVKRIFPSSHATVQEVQMIANRLRDICVDEGMIPSNKQFNLYVIDSPVANAFVLPNGSIFVYTGILPYAQTQAGLASILGHEIAHALARHSAEKIGYINMLMIVTEFIRGFSDHQRSFSAIFAEFVAISFLQPLFTLAHSRHCETEADEIGVKLAAKAGYDPRHSAQVWQRMILSSSSSSSNDDGGGEDGDDYAIKDAKRGGRPGENMLTKDINNKTPTTTTTTTKSSLASSTTNPSTTHHSSSTTSTSSSSLTMHNRLSELLSTHPCHERRVEALQAHSADLMDTYRKASEDLFMQSNLWDTSDRLLLISHHKPVRPPDNPRIADILLTSPDEFSRGGDNQEEQEEEDTERSMRIAKDSASLMVGSQGEEWRAFIQSLELEGLKLHHHSGC